MSSVRSGAIAGKVIDFEAPEAAFTVAFFADGFYLGETETETSGGGESGTFLLETPGASLTVPYTIRMCLANDPAVTLASFHVPTQEAHQDALLRYEGRLEGIRDGALVGWARDRLNPTIPVNVEFRSDDDFIGSCLADGSDLSDDGHHLGCRFSFPIPAHMLNGRLSLVNASIREARVALPGSPCSFSLSVANVLAQRLAKAERQIEQLIAVRRELEESSERAIAKMAASLVLRTDAMILLVRENIEREMSGLRALFGNGRSAASRHAKSANEKRILLDDKIAGFGWYKQEMTAAGVCFRWMNETASLVTDFSSSAEAAVAVYVHLVVDEALLSQLVLTVNDQQVLLNATRHPAFWIAEGTVPAIAWSLAPVSIIKLHCVGARRPSNGDNRLLSLAITEIRLRALAIPSEAAVDEVGTIL